MARITARCGVCGTPSRDNWFPQDFIDNGWGQFGHFLACGMCRNTIITKSDMPQVGAKLHDLINQFHDANATVYARTLRNFQGDPDNEKEMVTIVIGMVRDLKPTEN